MISVVILGAGNVATHLFKGFSKTNEVSVVQWYNRSLSAIQSYENKVDVTDDLNTLKDADVYILAVSDDVIGELSSKLPFKNKLVVHTSGSVSVYDIDKKHKRGVLYPLQSFSKNAEMDFANVPICIETIDKACFPILKELSLSLGSPIKRINSDQRRVLHLAAVFVNNFTNQLYRIGHEITESEGAEFDLLKPLILETAKKVQEMSPFKAQTGPAKRNNKKTIKKHLKTLESQHHKDIYELLTKSIIHTHGRKKL
ncbi:F420-dependent NADP oxidoreductase [Algibacter sp.]|nr:F420-dependent NADP oxidoreductase [Algibacter sp.]MDC1226354.1 F420-dependent NADP oxidoreductase [Algibacter sp.]